MTGTIIPVAQTRSGGSRSGVNPSGVEGGSAGWLTRKIRYAFLQSLRRRSALRVEWVDAFGTESIGSTNDHPVTVRVHDLRFYRRLLTAGSLGFADGYIQGEWECEPGETPDGEPELTRLFRMVLRSDQCADDLDRGFARLSGWLSRFRHALRSNHRKGSRRNISAHYDLGNEFFRIFLDETLAYSSGVFETPESTLEEASLEKFRRLTTLLDLGPDDHLLEIGTGWGGFALYAARETGCRITTTTISQEQYTLARERISAAGLADRVDVQLKDYRDLDGTYDKAVAIEMIEAVGQPYLSTFFGKIGSLLKPGGAFALQAITMPDHRYERYLRSVDFIRAFVFPGSCCPSVAAMTGAAATGSDLRLTSLEDIGPHYATTLREWRRRFWEKIDEVRAQGYPDTFVRLWDYYMCYCEAGFAERYTGDVHMPMTRPGYGAGEFEKGTTR